MIVHLPPDPDREGEEQFLMDMTDPQVLRLQEFHQRALDARRITEYQCPQDPLPDGTQQVWTRSHKSTGWQPLGYILDEAVTFDAEPTDPDESAFLAWPHKRGKTSFSLDLEVPLTSGMRALFDALEASHRAALDRRLVRLADALGRLEPHVRRDFHAVQRVLEDAGALDGYGRVTVPQPVRPPIEPPAAVPGPGALKRRR